MSVIGLPLAGFPDTGIFDGEGAQSVASPRDLLAANPGVIPIYLLVAEPYDPGTAATVGVYEATAPFTTAASDTPASQAFGVNHLRIPIELTNRLTLSRGTLRATGSTSGDIVLDTFNPADRVDELAGYAWDGRDVKVLIGFAGYTLAECSEIFTGTAEGLSWSDDAIRIRTRSPRFRLERNIQTTLYAGTGGVEGGAELTGKPKPLAYGPVRQYRPILIDGTNLIYQVHDGTINAVNAVRDRGIALTLDADYANYAALVAASVASSEYATCLAEGLFRLGAQPAGIVTTDFEGDKSGSLGVSGYTSTAADNVRKIVSTKGDLTDPDEVEVGAFDDLNTAQPAAVGFATGLEPVLISDAVDRIAGAVGAFVDFTRVGRITITRLVDPTTATTTDTITSVVRESFAGQQADIPAHKIKLGYRRYWQPLSGQESASSLSEDTRADYAESLRVVPANDATILTVHPSAAEYPVETLIDTLADATAEATRLLALYKPSRHVYEVEAWNGLYGYELGQVVTLQVARYDLASGKNFVIIGIRDAPMVGTNHENRVGLTLWGRED